MIFDIFVVVMVGILLLACALYGANYILDARIIRKGRRLERQEHAAQEREEARARIQERRKWWPWVQMSAWDDAYQSISEQAGIKCDGCNEDRRGSGGFITRYQPNCPLHKHRWRTLSPPRGGFVYHHLEDVQPVLDRLDITPPRYTEEGTLL